MLSWMDGYVIVGHKRYTSLDVNINILDNEGFKKRGMVITGNQQLDFTYDIKRDWPLA